MRISDWSSDVCSSDLPAFQHHALMVAESYRQFMDKPLGDDEVRVRFSAQPYIVTAENAGQLIHQSQLMASYSDHNPPFELKSARGGSFQFRLVAALPSELTPAYPALTAKNFYDQQRKR